VTVIASEATDELAPPIVHLEHVMGTVVTFTLYPGSETDEPDLYRTLARARALLQRDDAVFSTWKHDSPMSRLRRGEITIEECPEVVGEVLTRCEELREMTEGWFDPWAMPGGIDPTGVVKGWAAERACRQFTDSSVGGVVVNAAGDVVTSGFAPGGKHFRIGIVDPHRRGFLATVVEVSGAVATSGSAERGPHLIDPHSGHPRAQFASASVTGPSLGTCDALATALVVAGNEGFRFIDGLDGYEAFTIGHDGSTFASSSFPFAAAQSAVSS
jgi:thiamine biosynthesis lipoprotein